MSQALRSEITIRCPDKSVCSETFRGKANDTPDALCSFPMRRVRVALVYGLMCGENRRRHVGIMQVPFCKSRGVPYRELLLLLLLIEGKIGSAGFPLLADLHHHRRHQP